MLEPIIQDSKVVEFNGLYKIQLEIPPSSTLTNYETRRILEIASWKDGEVSDKVDGYEGGRSVLIEREVPDYRDNIVFEGLQISGVGYRQLKNSGTFGVLEGTEISFQPPSTSNFFEKMSNVGRTANIVDGKWISEQEQYAPVGTYSENLLRRKVGNTLILSKLRSKRFLAPTVEAYGRYVDLIDVDGKPCGFLVTPIPDVNLPRYGDWLLIESQENLRLLYHSGKILIKLAKALRELHDLGFVHRQPHLGNFYDLEDTIYLVDWATMLPLRQDLRAVDIGIVHASINSIVDYAMKSHGQEDEMFSQDFGIVSLEVLLRSYLGLKKIKIREFHSKLSRQLGRNAGYNETVIHFLRKHFQD